MESYKIKYSLNSQNSIVFMDVAALVQTWQVRFQGAEWGVGTSYHVSVNIGFEGSNLSHPFDISTGLSPLCVILN